MSGRRAHGESTLGPARWKALGTNVELRLSEPARLDQRTRHDDATRLLEARASVERELNAIDSACSRFRADSELSQLNARAGHPVHVSRLLMEALDLALAAATLTEGDVDPTVGLALELSGYNRDWRELAPARDEPSGGPMTLYALIGWRTISLDRDTSTVRMPAGVRLDLGATAKAWAADRAAHAASAAARCGALVSLGGDIAVRGQAPVAGWTIRVTDDHRSTPDAPGQTVTIESGGLATSSTTVRRWSHRGQTMHHIIDPRTAAPARSPWRTVSVAAEDCAQANIATTAALVRGEGALDWLTQQRLPARLVDREGRITTLGDWPAAQGAPAFGEQRAEAIAGR